MTTLEQEFGDINFITDIERGRDLLPNFIKDEENIKNLMNAILPEIQEPYDSAKDIFVNINLDLAIGSQLDDIFGEILGLERFINESDDSYRLRLKANYQQISGSGEISLLKSVYESITGATDSTLSEHHPATVMINAMIPSGMNFDSGIARMTMDNAKAAGIRLILTKSNNVNPFTLVNKGDSLNSALGLSSRANPTSGGILGEKL